MRLALLVILAALFVPSAAIAQSATPTSPGTTAAPGARSRGGDITRDEYIERARRAAEKRFDRLDTNHDGVLTADERRAAREQRGQRRSTQPAQ